MDMWLTISTHLRSGTKTWVDDDDHDGQRPDSITVKLLADGTVIKSLVVTADTDWNYSFTDLPKYRDNGTLIKYSVSENAVSGYKASVTGYDITNTYKPNVIKLTKTGKCNVQCYKQCRLQ